MTWRSGKVHPSSQPIDPGSDPNRWTHPIDPGSDPKIVGLAPLTRVQIFNETSVVHHTPPCLPCVSTTHVDRVYFIQAGNTLDSAGSPVLERSPPPGVAPVR